VLLQLKMTRLTISTHITVCTHVTVLKTCQKYAVSAQMRDMHNLSSGSARLQLLNSCFQASWHHVEQSPQQNSVH
jgi:hypothetical protein